MHEIKSSPELFILRLKCEIKNYSKVTLSKQLFGLKAEISILNNVYAEQDITIAIRAYFSMNLKME